MMLQRGKLSLCAVLLAIVSVSSGLAACASSSTSRSEAAVATDIPTAIPTFPPPTPTQVSTDACPSPWLNEPEFSSSLINGAVLLPAKTRVVMVNQAPGETDATLCTLDATAASITTTMNADLKAKGWHLDAGEWQQQGSAVEISWSVTDPLNWDFSCLCDGI